VNDILSDGMAEVETATLARERAANPDVKQFAQMMIDDHTKAGDQLKQIANTYAIPLDRAKQIKDNVDHNNRNTRGTTGANDTKAKGASKY
jgi:putative membrane protein